MIKTLDEILDIMLEAKDDLRGAETAHDVREADNQLAEAHRLIEQAIMVAKPTEIDDGDGWNICFGQSDTTGVNGRVIKKVKVRSCCPGDDIAYAHNTAIAEYEANLRVWLGKGK